MEIIINTPTPLGACDRINELSEQKADNITFVNNILQLSANGTAIGNAIEIADIGSINTALNAILGV